MTDRPAIFSAPMVRALIAKGKTMTRRCVPCPLEMAKPGDRLWVRESWAVESAIDEQRAKNIDSRRPVFYFADQIWRNPINVPTDTIGRHRASLHMPRWASRLTLTVTGVCHERLQDISHDDALAEGISEVDWQGEHWSVTEFRPHELTMAPTAAGAYKLLWGLLHAEHGQRWQDNPMVAVISFAVSLGNIDYGE